VNRIEAAFDRDSPQYQTLSHDFHQFKTLIPKALFENLERGRDGFGDGKYREN